MAEDRHRERRTSVFVATPLEAPPPTLDEFTFDVPHDHHDHHDPPSEDSGVIKEEVLWASHTPHSFIKEPGLWAITSPQELPETLAVVEPHKKPEKRGRGRKRDSEEAVVVDSGNQDELVRPPRPQQKKPKVSSLYSQQRSSEGASSLPTAPDVSAALDILLAANAQVSQRHMHMAKEGEDFELEEGMDATGSQIHVCEVLGCGKSYSTTSHLRRHMLTHTQDKPFVCKECNKAFHLPHHLVYHERIHTGEKPYVCTQENCGKAYSQPGDYYRHMRKHTGASPYACDFPGCDKSFVRSRDLVNHKKSTHR